MARSRFIYFLALAGIIAFYIFFIGTTAWYLLCAALVIPIISLVVTVLSYEKVKIDTRLPRYFTCGEKTELLYCVSMGKKGLPVRGRLKMRVNGGNIITEFISGEENSWTLDARICSEIKIELYEVHLIDYLGLFRIPLKIEEEHSIFALPKPVPCKIPETEIGVENIPGELYTRRASGVRSSIYELREYKPGDMIRDIHWKASAKTDTTVVRDYQPENDIVLALTVDVLPLTEEKNEVLGRLLSISKQLLREGRPHLVMWIEPKTHELMNFSVPYDGDIIDFLCMFVGKMPDGESPRISETELDIKRFDICSGDNGEGETDK